LTDVGLAGLYSGSNLNLDMVAQGAADIACRPPDFLQRNVQGPFTDVYALGEASDPL
jgi:hypothetical protein